MAEIVAILMLACLVAMLAIVVFCATLSIVDLVSTRRRRRAVVDDYEPIEHFPPDRGRQ